MPKISAFERIVGRSDMEWQIKSLAKVSGISGREIKAGDNVVCVVFVDAMGNLDRLDAHVDEFDDSKINGKIIGRWERVIGDNPEADERAARRMAIAGSEDFFLSLYDENSAVQTDEVEVVKQILALMLERKRILRPIGRAANGMQKYLHISSKREFDVPQKEVDAELVVKIQTQLGSIII